MAIDFSNQFSPDHGDRVYKGVHLTQHRGRGNPRYSYTYWWKAPSGLRYGGVPDENTPRKWVSAMIGPTTFDRVKQEINRHLERGYTVHPNGHMRAPDYPE